MDITAAAYKIIFFVVMVQISLAFVNAVGIFPIEREFNHFIDSDLTAKLTSMQTESSGFLGSGAVDALMFVWNAFGILVGIVINIPSAIPDALQIFFIPAPIANTIGLLVNLLLVLSVATIALNRGG